MVHEVSGNSALGSFWLMSQFWPRVIDSIRLFRSRVQSHVYTPLIGWTSTVYVVGVFLMTVTHTPGKTPGKTGPFTFDEKINLVCVESSAHGADFKGS